MEAALALSRGVPRAYLLPSPHQRQPDAQLTFKPQITHKSKVAPLFARMCVCLSVCLFVCLSVCLLIQKDCTDCMCAGKETIFDVLLGSVLQSCMIDCCAAMLGMVTRPLAIM